MGHENYLAADVILLLTHIYSNYVDWLSSLFFLASPMKIMEFCSPGNDNIGSGDQ